MTKTSFLPACGNAKLEELLQEKGEKPLGDCFSPWTLPDFDGWCFEISVPKPAEQPHILSLRIFSTDINKKTDSSAEHSTINVVGEIVSLCSSLALELGSDIESNNLKNDSDLKNDIKMIDSVLKENDKTNLDSFLFSELNEHGHAILSKAVSDCGLMLTVDARGLLQKPPLVPRNINL